MAVLDDFSQFLVGTDPAPSRPLDMTPDEFAGLRNPLSDAIMALIATGGGGQAPGRVVPMTRAETSLLGDVRGQGRVTGTEQQTINSLLGQGRQRPNPAEIDLLSRVTQFGRQDQPLQGALEQQLMATLGGDFMAEGNPFLSGMIEAATRPVLEAYERIGLPQLKRAFTARGHTIQPESSSPFDMAAAMAQGDVLNQVGDRATQLSYQAFGDERNRQMAAAGMVPEALQAELARMTEALGARSAFDESELRQRLAAVEGATGLSESQMRQSIQALQASALPRMIKQMGIDQGTAEFQRRLSVLLQVLQMGGALASPTVGQIGGIPQQSGLLPTVASQIAGGAAEGAGSALGSAASNALAAYFSG